MALLDVKDLKTYFRTDDGIVKAVDGVSFSVEKGKTLGIVGESGCGKSVTCLTIMGLNSRKTSITSGEAMWKGKNLIGMSAKQLRAIRGDEIAMIFQDPMTSLNPVHKVGSQLTEAILLHQDITKAAARRRALDLLKAVGIPRADARIDDYPHQFSGGMRQRVMIAMALVNNPDLLIADEPTTALDVTTEAQILDLLLELQNDFGMAMQYITHNMGVVAELVDDVVVMYLGKPVEYGPVEEIFENPQHPYTRALLRAIPKLGKKSRERLASIKGMVPDPYRIPTGCAFHPRCPRHVPDVCAEPVYVDVGPDHRVLCNRAGDPWE